MGLLKENKRFRDLFKKYLKTSAVKTTTSTTYAYGGASAYSQRWDGIPVEDRCTIYFYEWSTMSLGSKVYYSYKKFYEFLDESKISYSDEDVKALKGCSFGYAVCKPGESVLMVADKYWTLKESLKAIQEEKGLNEFSKPIVKES